MAAIFHPNIYFFLAGFLALILGMKLYSVGKRGWKAPGFARDLFKGIVVWACYFVIIYTISVWLGGYGLLGFIILILLLSAWRIWKARELYMTTVNYGVDMLRGRKR